MISAFLSRGLLEHLSAGKEAGQASTPPQGYATCLADLSGFSRLADELGAAGPSGAEQVTEALNSCFTPTLSAIAAQGGDVITFAGDAILAAWPADGDLATAVARAARAGLDAVARVDALPPVAGHRLQLRVTIGAGEATRLDLGGQQGRWHHALVGPAVQQLATAGAGAAPGEVSLSREALLALGPRGRAEGARLRAVEAPPAQPIPPLVALSPAAAIAARGYVPEPVLGALEAGQSRWLAEVRPVTSLFVSLREVDLGNPRTRLTAEEGFRAVQDVLVRYGGGVHKVTVDEKGVLVVAVFGLPPHSHEENAARGVRAALELQAALRALELEHGIGITTGRALCGVLGGELRRDYTVIAPVVNLAARLMQKAASNDTLCDEATVRACRGWVRFADLGTVNVKGSNEPVAVFRPLWGERHEVRQRTVTRLREGLQIVGREAEGRQLAGQAHHLATGGSGVVILEGEAGIGKSTLLAELVCAADEAGAQVLLGAGDSMERNSPWHAWADVVQAVLGLDELRGKELRHRRLLKALTDAEVSPDLAPLLEPLVRLDLPDTDATRGLHGTTRHDRIVDLVVDLLARAARAQPLLVAIDDAHWLDSASWQLAEEVQRRVHPLLLTIANRPMEEPTPRPWRALCALPETTRIPVGTLPAPAVVEIVRRRLGANALPEEVSDLVVQRSEGNPFFAEEVAYALRDAGRLRVVGGQCLLDPTRAVEVPATLLGLVTARIDRLPAEEQPTVKVASVIGRSFGLELLDQVNPSPPGRLEVHLADLERLQIAVPETPTTWSFKHAITREAAYSLLPFGQRKEVHLSVARWYEGRLSDLDDTVLPVLAWHYRAGADAARALDWVERAGDAARDQGAHREAAHFYAEAQELGAELVGTAAPPATRRARWAAGLGEARLGLGDLEGAHAALGSALATLGEELPARTFGRVGRLLSELLRQLLHLVAPPTPDPSGPSELLARTAALVGEICYFRADIPGWALASLFAINRAERAGDPTLASRAYSGLANLVGTAGLTRLMNRYLALSRRSNDPSARMAADWAEAVLLLTVGRFDEAISVARRGVELGTDSGARYEQGIGITVLGYAQSLSAPVPTALETLRWGLESARSRGNRQHLGWCLALQVPLLLALEERDAALAMAEEALDALPGSDPLSVPIAHGVKAAALRRSGRPVEALEEAARAMDAFRTRPPAVYIYLPGYHGVLEALSDPRVAGDPRVKGLTKEALGALRGFARLFPIGRPRLRLWEGRLGGGARVWEAGLREAARFGLDAGPLHLALAGVTTGDTRAGHLDAAATAFGALGDRHGMQGVDTARRSGGRDES